MTKLSLKNKLRTKSKCFLISSDVTYVSPHANYIPMQLNIWKVMNCIYLIELMEKLHINKETWLNPLSGLALEVS